MSDLSPRLRDFLDARGVEYEVVHHHTDHTAEQTAWDTHTSPREFAKTVFVCVDGSFAMAVLPAADMVSEEKLRLALDAREVRIAEEDEFDGLCPDCELGAEPPFGSLYRLPVYASPALAAHPSITFNGGSHREAVRMPYADWARLAEPRVVPLGRHD